MTDVLGLPAPPNQPIEPARIPSDGELDRWEAQYKATYRAQHAARNDALDRMATGLDDRPMRADVLLATLEAHEAAADGFVDVGEVDRIARARGRGFSDRRAHIAATWNPYRPGTQTEYHYGSFMAWYAGWKQAGQTVDRNPETRPRGYTPPQPGAKRPVLGHGGFT
jgi:hypothetical protein